ncbi:MAG: hypothetical protein R3D71_01725 [Rickettsiales bacterium]
MEQNIFEEIDKNVRILTLITGTLEDGSEHWAYASIPFSKYQNFKEAEKKGNYDLADYGSILKHGVGKIPPENIIQEMKEEYGADHRFEEELEQIMRQIDGLNL